MLLAALVAFVATLVAFAGVTALLRGWSESRQGYLLSGAVTLLSLSAGLGAATINLALDFRPLLFRVFEVGAGLLAMLWLALTAVELTARGIPAKFAARLYVVSLSIVAGVILALDPLQEVDGSAPLPESTDLYLSLPLRLLAGVHASVVLIVSACFVAVAVRAWRGREDVWETFLACLFLVLAALLVFVAVRPAILPVPTAMRVAMLAAAAVLVWVVPVRAMRASEPDEEEERDYWLGLKDHGSEEATAPSAAPGPARGQPPEEGTGTQPNSRQGPEPSQQAEVPPQVAQQLAREAGQPPGQGDALAEACGHIVIFTLREGAARPFDRLADATVQEIKNREPGTLVYACHAVADAPQQRIFYELYRDRAAMQEHERQPHVRRFLAEREQYVLATNVVRLKLSSHSGIAQPEFT